MKERNLSPCRTAKEYFLSGTLIANVKSQNMKFRKGNFVTWIVTFHVDMTSWSYLQISSQFRQSSNPSGISRIVSEVLATFCTLQYKARIEIPVLEIFSQLSMIQTKRKRIKIRHHTSFVPQSLSHREMRHNSQQHVIRQTVNVALTLQCE